MLLNIYRLHSSSHRQHCPCSKQVGLRKSDKLVHTHKISVDFKSKKWWVASSAKSFVRNFHTRLFPRLGAQTWGACAFDASSCESPGQTDAGVIQKRWIATVVTSGCSMRMQYCKIRKTHSWCNNRDTLSYGARNVHGTRACTCREFPSASIHPYSSHPSLNSVLQFYPKMARVFQGSRPWLRTLCQLCWVEARNCPRLFQLAFGDPGAKEPRNYM